MKRRLVLKQLACLVGGTVVVPRFLMGGEMRSIPPETLKFGDKVPIVASVAEIIIPKTDTPGAKDLGVQLFVLKMVEDCYEEEAQHAFLKGLEQLDLLSNQRFGKDFIKCSAHNQSSIIQTIEEQSELPNELLDCFAIIKRRTIQGYMTSEYVMTKQLVYEVAPGRYNGYHQVS